MRNLLKAPEAGEGFNNCFLPKLKLTCNQWQQIDEKILFSDRYLEFKAIVKTKDGKCRVIGILSREEYQKQMSMIRSTLGNIYAYFGKLKPDVHAIVGVISSQEDLNNKITERNLIYCDEAYVVRTLYSNRQFLIYCHHHDGKCERLSLITQHFITEKKKFGKIYKFYTVR